MTDSEPEITQVTGEKATYREGSVPLTYSDPADLTGIAIAHFRAVLADPDATDTAKSNAANGLAAIDRQQRKAEGQIHRLSRQQITAEIARVMALGTRPSE